MKPLWGQGLQALEVEACPSRLYQGKSDETDGSNDQIACEPEASNSIWPSSKTLPRLSLLAHGEGHGETERRPSVLRCIQRFRILGGICSLSSDWGRGSESEGEGERNLRVSTASRKPCPWEGGLGSAGVIGVLTTP